MIIKHRFSDEILFEGDFDTVKDCFEAAVRKGVDLRGADLRYADLRYADLRGAYLEGINFRGADLRYADLRGAYLRGAYLEGADLSYADLRGADLEGINFRGAYFKGAYLEGVNLRGAYLRGAYLRGVDLTDTILPNFKIIPEEGSFIGWKKTTKGVAKLLITEDSKRVSTLVGRKCRASKVKVLESPGGTGPNRGGLTYTEGDILKVSDFDDDIRVECTEGIHFFLTRKEAEEW